MKCLFKNVKFVANNVISLKSKIKDLRLLNIQKYNLSDKTCLGKPIRGINPTKMTEKDVKEVKDQVFKNGAIVLKGGITLTPQQLTDFSRQFGHLPILDHVFINYEKADNCPEITRITNINKDGSIKKGVKAAEYWHQDGNFREGRDIYLWNILHTNVIPKKGGDTGFVDTRRVLKFIPDWLYKFLKEATIDVNPANIKDFKKEEAEKRPIVTHKCIQNHAVTGDEHLYLGLMDKIVFNIINSSFSQEILNVLKEYIEREDNLFVHKWEEGDIIMWDNTLSMHKSIGFYEDNPRLLLRAQVFV